MALALVDDGRGFGAEPVAVAVAVVGAADRLARNPDRSKVFAVGILAVLFTDQGIGRLGRLPTQNRVPEAVHRCDLACHSAGIMAREGYDCVTNGVNSGLFSRSRGPSTTLRAVPLPCKGRGGDFRTNNTC